MARMFICGASDAEMHAVEMLLGDCGQQAAYAVDENARRVHLGNAYAAAGVQLPPGMSVDDKDVQYVLIECGFASSSPWAEMTKDAVIIDHHHPHPNSQLGADRFLEASSIGQIISLLAKTGALPRGWLRTRDCTLVPGTFGRSSTWWVSGAGCSYQVPHELTLIAAADHCLLAAYQDLCPAINPHDLLDWRTESRAAFQGRKREAVASDIRQAMSLVLERDKEQGEPEVVDMTGQVIPELPEAACRLGIPVLAGPLRTPDGRQKIVLQAASSSTIEKFLAGKIAPNLTDRYGSPARGFAGGYLEET